MNNVSPRFGADRRKLAAMAIHRQNGAGVQISDLVEWQLAVLVTRRRDHDMHLPRPEPIAEYGGLSFDRLEAYHFRLGPEPKDLRAKVAFRGADIDDSRRTVRKLRVSEEIRRGAGKRAAC